MLEVYYGDGKGKTTSAIGGAIRALGSGMRVLFIGFFKNGSSSEMNIIKKLPNFEAIFSSCEYKLFQSSDEENVKKLKASYDKILLDLDAKKYDFIVLDEGLDAYKYGYVDKKIFYNLINSNKNNLEIVLTGHNLPQEILDISDYISLVKSEKHPYEHGISARKGIEY